MNDLFEEPDSATPLTVEERRELIPAHIAYRRELNEAEQDNPAPCVVAMSQHGDPPTLTISAP